MNKLTFAALFITYSFLFNHLCQANCDRDDWEALKALYNSTDGENWLDRTGWEIIYNQATYPGNNCDLNTLYGVTVEDGRVTCIDMDGNPDCNKSIQKGGNNLKGPIPPEIRQLKNVKFLYLFQNNLSGSLPIELFELNCLEVLALRDNKLSGEIPSQIGDLRNLRELYLDDNNFSGNIPIELTTLSNLTWCSMYNNTLTGDIPKEIGNLSKLIGLQICKNQLTGNIPTELYNLTELRQLWLYQNELTGTISPDIKKLKNLTHLGLFSNKLTGVIPPEIGSLSNLTWLSIRSNCFTGSILSELGNLSKLTLLELSYNKLYGRYPNNFITYCTQLTDPEFGGNSDISDGNNFDASWEDYCETGAGACVGVPTNHSGYVTLNLDNNQKILKNKYATVYDCNTCADYKNVVKCSPVTGFDNQSANEALWVVTKAAEYISIHYNIEVPSVDIFVNDMEDPYALRYFPSYKVIVLGAGDGTNRGPASAPDIVAHEYLHFLQDKVEGFFSPLQDVKEAGALRESLADIFGEIIEKYCYGENDWVFGSQITINKMGIRSHSNPKDVNMVYKLPNYYGEAPWVAIGEWCTSSNDDGCGIHTNCGVHNYWFYILANHIGFESATNIVIENFRANLDSTATYKDIAISSIKTAGKLFGNNSMQQKEVIKAWNKVGIYFEELDINLNFLQFMLEIDTIKNIIINGNKYEEVFLHLIIDSLGQDIFADGLNFTLYLDKIYEQFTAEDTVVYKPLDTSEIKIKINENEINVSVHRKAKSGKREQKDAIQKIKSNEPVLGIILCIPEIDTSEKFCYPYIPIYGHSELNVDEKIIFESDKLYFGSCRPADGDIDSPDGGEACELLHPTINISQKNCYSLGTFEIEMPDYIVDDFTSFTYTLYKNGTQLEQILTEENSYLFSGLEIGSYIVIVEDNKCDKAEVDFDIEFVAKMNGSNCCPNNLTIPPGRINGLFNATETISFENGSTVPEGDFIICEEQ